MNLKYKDMYAIKHALKERLEGKEITLFLDGVTSDNNLTPDEVAKLKKDIDHEKRLIEKFETAISDFKAKNKIK